MLNIDVVRFDGDKKLYEEALKELIRLGYKINLEKALTLDVKNFNLLVLNEDSTVDVKSHFISTNEISVNVLKNFKWYDDEEKDLKINQLIEEIQEIDTKDEKTLKELLSKYIRK